jgi:restriction system protein
VAIPDFQTIMLPLLEFASDGKEHSMEEARDFIARHFKLSDEERQILLPSGRQALFSNRVAWSRTYLTQAELLHSPRRGAFVISSRGRQVLSEKPPKITVKYLERFPEFVEFRSSTSKTDIPTAKAAVAEDSDTPEELLEDSYQKLKSGISAELISRIKKASAEFFEQLVVDLLIRMGYGGSRKEAGQAIGRTGDEGIDGVINEDRLGLDVIYLQAKKWEGTVGRPEVQKFVGALHGKRARKGVFITTGAFSSDAQAYVEHIDPKVIPIDGRRLAELMIDFDLGVTEASVYRIKRIDFDYFGDE